MLKLIKWIYLLSKPLFKSKYLIHCLYCNKDLSNPKIHYHFQSAVNLQSNNILSFIFHVSSRSLKIYSDNEKCISEIKTSSSIAFVTASFFPIAFLFRLVPKNYFVQLNGT